MRKMLSILATVAVLGCAVLATAQGTPVQAPDTVATKDLVATLDGDPQFKTFVRLVKLGGLDKDLTPVEPTETPPPDPVTYTVLAPTEKAFAKLPPGSLEQLEKQPEMLMKLIQYHVVKGTLNQADLKDGDKLKTLEGEEIEVKVTDDKPKLGIASIKTADTKAKNGVVHAIDTVLVPPSLLEKQEGTKS